MLFLRLPSVCLLLFLHSLSLSSPLVSPPSILHTHPIFNCWNCKYSLYEKVKLNHNHSEVIMKLVFKPVCLFSEARPACWKLLWGTECSMLFCDCLPVPGSCLSAPTPLIGPATQAGGRGEEAVLERLAGNVSGLFGGRRNISALRVEGWVLQKETRDKPILGRS